MTLNKLCASVVSVLSVAAGVIFLSASTAAAAPPDVVFASYGGSFQDAQTKAFLEPFTKSTGIKVVGTTGSSYAKLKAMVKSNTVSWDVVSAESSAYANEMKDELLQPLDYSIIDAKGIPPLLRSKYGVGYIKFGMNLAWSKDKFPGGMTPAQFFNPSVKARRAVPLEPEYILEFALLADGVKATNLYPLDVNRALKVIERVKGQIVAYKGAADTQALIQQGEVDAAFIPNGRVNNAIKAGAPWAYGWEAAVSDTEWWVVPKGAPNAKGAMQFINFALQPAQQAALTQQIPYGPTNVLALKLLDTSVAKDLPSDPDNEKLGATLNPRWWNDNRESVKTRWSTFIMQ